MIYETWLIQRTIQKILNKLKDKNSLFSLNSITSDGSTIEYADGKIKQIRYLADEDILLFMKEHYDDISEAREYLDRGYRRKAIWKSHDEYIAICKSIGVTDDFYSVFQKYFIDRGSIGEEEKPFENFDDEALDLFKKVVWPNHDPELLFLTYQSKYQDSIDADEIFIDFPCGCCTFSEFNTVAQLNSEDGSQIKGSNTPGFYVYERRQQLQSTGTDIQTFISNFKSFLATTKKGFHPL